jgi:S-methylmethionine-dependent homocysteine/selenocysteine methylase/SAM-dependent methyltransferase
MKAVKASGHHAPIHSAAYSRLTSLIAAEECVILDGGVATEIERIAGAAGPDLGLWGTWALYREPQIVLDVHRAYVEAGCNVISTDTWSILSAPDAEKRPGEAGHWMDAARLGVKLARRAVEDAGRTGACAVAFAISEEVNSRERRGTIDLLTRVLEEEPPDLLLLETMTLIRDPATFETVDRLLETGLPVWLSFRRCRHGVCGVFGQHWGPPEGDEFGRAARRFEEMGVGALLINCLPVDHVPGMVSWLRDFTGLPLGVYPNLGHLSGSHWRFDEETTPQAFANLALEWRAEGAQIIGGCCGVTPEHIAAARVALEGTKPQRRRPDVEDLLRPEVSLPAPEPWRDEQGRTVNPLPFPKLSIDEGVFVPTTGSYLVWKALFNGRLGEGKKCLDVGCGCGILAVQLALNGAAHVHAIDIDQGAVENTLGNAFRNGVADRVSGEAIDLYHWRPLETFDLIAASLYQMPVDPYEEPNGHRPLDYWGRSLVDYFIRLLPRLLADDGVAYLMQLSIVGPAETTRLLAGNGFEARVVDFSFFPFGSAFEPNMQQIARVEESSDAYHLRFGSEDVMVAYLLEITRSGVDPDLLPR